MEITTEMVEQCLAEMSSQFDSGSISASEMNRFARTLSYVPPAKCDNDHLVDLGAHALWIPLYVKILGYRNITVVRRQSKEYLDKFDFSSLGSISIVGVDTDLELADYPIAEDSADCVVCFEVIEHLVGDPMHLLVETNRILKPEGEFVLSMPNVLWRDNVVRYLFGGHPYGWSVYTGVYGDRHNREWTPFETEQALTAAGFDNVTVATENCAPPGQNFSLIKWVISFLFILPAALRGRRGVPLKYRNSLIFARSRPNGPVLERYPSFLYEMYGRKSVEMPDGLLRRN